MRLDFAQTPDGLEPQILRQVSAAIDFLIRKDEAQSICTSCQALWHAN